MIAVCYKCITMTVGEALGAILKNPGEMLVRRWNWKSALFSSTLRALVFLFANLAAGWHAAVGAGLAEFLYRGVAAGFYGAITQALREAEPEWLAGAAAMILLPLISHSIELAIHLARGTPKIVTSIISSVIFTMVSTLFNVYAMRRGALVTGEGGDTLSGDLQRVPRLIWNFVAAGPRWILRERAPKLPVEAR